MLRLMGFLRNHLHFIIIVPALIVVMTWPVTEVVLDADTPLRMAARGDVFMKFWDAWYGLRMLSGQEQFYHTELLFYPIGLSLDYHNFCLPHILVFNGLQTILSPIAAYGLTHMLIVLANAVAAYALMLHLFRDKWLALVGAVVFGLSPYVLSRPYQPDLSLVATIPLAVYAFHRGVSDGSVRWLVAAGAVIGGTVFIGMYIFVCLLLTLGIYGLYFLVRRWRQLRFWLGIVVVLAVMTPIGLLRVYPMIANSHRLDDALDKIDRPYYTSDLMEFLVNHQNPALKPLFDAVVPGTQFYVFGNGYLGYALLLLTGVGLALGRCRRAMLPWLIVFVVFVLLRLGDVLVVANHYHTDIVLPRFHLAEAVPWIFKAFWNTKQFQIGILLPMAILACFGMRALSALVRPRWRAAFVLALLLVIVAERFQEPRLWWASEDKRFDWMDWLKGQDDQDAIRLINLPMGRDASKSYGYHQSLLGYPHVEGLASRTPPESYAYIDANLLLRTWRSGNSVHCTPLNRGAYRSALEQLITDGFSHIVWHRRPGAQTRLASGFLVAPAAYSDDYVAIYRVADLGAACGNAKLVSPAFRAGSSDDWLRGAVLPAQKQASLLSIHPIDGLEFAPDEVFSAALFGQDHLSLLNLEDLALRDPLAHLRGMRDADEAPVSSGVILLMYDPSRGDGETVAAYREWIGREFRRCRRLVDEADAVVEYYIRADFPCELGLSETPIAVAYDNGIELANLWYGREGDRLDVYLMWKALPRETYSFSIQFIDAEGNRALGYDDSFQYNAFVEAGLDLSRLAPGTYRLNMIVYHYETLASVSGRLVGSDTRFARAVEIGQLTIE